MNENDLYRAFQDLDDDLLERSQTARPRRRVPRWGILAACLTLMLSVTGIAVVAEAREYDAAVAFFDENGLSAAGLSREDVKAVYRDITTQRFTYDKTAEVIEQAVPGVEIFQPTPEKLAELWNNKAPAVSPFAEPDYRVEIIEREDEELGFSVFDKCRFGYYEDGTQVWQAEFDQFCADGWSTVSDGLAVWGWTPTLSSEQPSPAWLARLDDAGSVLWERQLDHGFESEYIAAVLDNGDGTWAVISRGDLRYLCLSQYNTEGSELSFCQTEVGNLGIGNAARLGEGYLVQLGNRVYGKDTQLVRMDRQGNLLDSFTYQGQDCDYYITDMIEFGSQVVLSAYAVPNQTDEGGRHEIANILDKLSRLDSLKISEEELTPLVRDNYTAVLLLCSPEGGEPETFYSVKGSLGGTLQVEGDQLRWDVESIGTTFYSPLTSSFSIGGTCQVYRYSFDTSGALVGQEDTGETVPYQR